MNETDFMIGFEPMMNYFQVTKKSRDFVFKVYWENLQESNGYAFQKISKWFIRTRQPMPSKLPTLEEIHMGISNHIRSNQVPEDMQPKRGCSKCDQGILIAIDQDDLEYLFSCGTCNTSDKQYPVAVYDYNGVHQIFKNGQRRMLEGWRMKWKHPKPELVKAQ